MEMLRNKRTFSETDPSQFEPMYRAISTPSGRHGIRLEHAFWETLKLIADDANCSVGSLVEEARMVPSSSNNLTSTIRVLCLTWICRRLDTLEESTSDKMIRSIIYACPTSALALSSDKRLHSFNQPFLRTITDKFSILDPEILPSRLRLVMDVQIESLIEQLSNNENQPITVGIAIGVDDRRIRGQLNVILAPSPQRNVILGYLLP